jgi:hypothetical protein
MFPIRHSIPTDHKMDDLPKTLNGMPVMGRFDPNAPPRDPNARPRYLHRLLEDETVKPSRENILKVLELYESGYDFTGGVWLVKGQIMPDAETARKQAMLQRETLWCEVYYLHCAVYKHYILIYYLGDEALSAYEPTTKAPPSVSASCTGLYPKTEHIYIYVTKIYLSLP